LPFCGALLLWIGQPQRAVRRLLFKRNMPRRKACNWRGEPQRMAKDVHQVLMSPVGEHSETPHEIRRRIGRLLTGPILNSSPERQLRAGLSGAGCNTISQHHDLVQHHLQHHGIQR
jgi:hypothetical protein